MFIVDRCAGGRTLVLVELKGSHLGDALSQIESTFAHLDGLPAFRGGKVSRRLAYVVCTSCKAVGFYAAKQQRIERRYNCRVKFGTRSVVVQLR